MDLPTPALIKPMELWTGKQLFSVMVRPNAQTRCIPRLHFATEWGREPAIGCQECCCEQDTLCKITERDHWARHPSDRKRTEAPEVLAFRADGAVRAACGCQGLVKMAGSCH